MNTRSRLQLLVVSINTWKCDGDYLERLKILTTQLEQINPDVICCQEAFQSHDGEFDTLRELSRALNMSRWFVPLRNKIRRFQGRPANSASGLGILTTWKIRSDEVLMLPDHPDDGGRAAQIVSITKSGKTVLVVNTHLTHLKKQEDLRLEQVKKIMATIASIKDHDLILVCGDFNATPESREIQYVKTHPQIPLVDLPAACSKDEKLVTFPALAPGREPSSPPKRIDYIFAVSPADRFQEEQVRSGLALNQPSGDGFFASDHFGVYADLQL